MELQRSKHAMLNIAIICPSKDAISETFIKAHRELLKGNIHYLYGGFIPTKSMNGKIRKENKYARLKNALPLFIYNKFRQTESNDLEKYFRAKKINVVLAEYGQSGCAVLPICKKLSIPLIVHFHGADASSKKVLDLYKNKYKELFDYCSYIVAVSHKMINRLAKLEAPSSKLVYAVYGPQDQFFNVNPDYANGYFLSVGRFVEKKAPFLTILAFKQLQDKHQNAKLVMVGDGPLLPICKVLVNSLGIRNIEFKGALPNDKVFSLFKQAFCFLQHSMIANDGDAEGTPVAILEAGAAGLPVISTFHEGIPDVVVHNKTGFLVQEGDIVSMADFMEKIFLEEKLRIEIGNNARNHIRNCFSMQKHINIIQDLIEKTCTKKNTF